MPSLRYFNTGFTTYITRLWRMVCQTNLANNYDHLLLAVIKSIGGSCGRAKFIFASQVYNCIYVIRIIYVVYTYSEVYASDEWWSSERSFELSLTKYEIWKCGIQKHKIGKYAFAWFLSGFEELLLGQLVRRRLKPHKHKILDQRHKYHQLLTPK